MSVANLQQNIQNRQLQIYNYSMSNYDADKFADWLTDAFNRSTFKSFAALADSAKLSRSTVSGLANAKKQSLTDKPSQPKIETVIELAKALGEDTDKARLAAGYAPENGKQNRMQLPNGLELVGINEDALPSDEWHELSAIIDLKIEKGRKLKTEQPNIGARNTDFISIPDRGALDDEMNPKKKRVA